MSESNYPEKPARLPRPALATLLLTAVSLALWAAIDRRSAGSDPQLTWEGVPLFAWYALAAVALAALLRWRSHPRPAYDRVLALVAGLIPVFLLMVGVAAPLLDERWYRIAACVVAIAALAYLSRGLRALTGRPQRLTALFGMTAIFVFIWASDELNVIPDLWTSADIQAPQASSDTVLADEETLLYGQVGRIDAVVGAFPAATSPQQSNFFLGFAGVGEEKVFAQEIALAARVIGRRYATEQRTLSLINDQRDLDTAPIASVSALRYALQRFAARMNLDRDVLFLSISSHGAEDPAIVVSNSDMPLNDLTDDALLSALSDSGIKWRVIVISACYAGGFIDSLKNSRTIVIAAAAADRTSFGCGSDSELTYFGEAFYRDALPKARSLRDAFETAKAAIVLRERRERVDASRPQAYFGAEIEAKLLR